MHGRGHRCRHIRDIRRSLRSRGRGGRRSRGRGSCSSGAVEVGGQRSGRKRSGNGHARIGVGRREQGVGLHGAGLGFSEFCVVGGQEVFDVFGLPAGHHRLVGRRHQQRGKAGGQLQPDFGSSNRPPFGGAQRGQSRRGQADQQKRQHRAPSGIRGRGLAHLCGIRMRMSGCNSEGDRALAAMMSAMLTPGYWVAMDQNDSPA